MRLARREPRRVLFAVAIPLLGCVGGVASLANGLLADLVGRPGADVVGGIVLVACAFAATHLGAVAAVAAIVAPDGEVE